jgi:hypothetical protein
MVVHNLDSLLITQVFPQTICREYDKTVTRLKITGDYIGIGTQYRPTEWLRSSELRFDPPGVILWTFQVHITYRS